MPDLRDDLRALAPDVDWPATPDLAAAVHARLTTGSDPFLHTHRKKGSDPFLRGGRGKGSDPWLRSRLVVVLVIALLALPAAAMAIPGSRHAILDALGLRHVTVERRAAPPRAASDPRLGTRTTLAGAARAAGFTPLVPGRLGPPRRVYERDGIITLVYDRPRALLLAQAVGEPLQRDLLRKIVSVDDHATRTTVGERPALFLGTDHAYTWSDATGPLVRSGPALIWEAGRRVLRLEGEPSLAAARAIAASAR